MQTISQSRRRSDKYRPATGELTFYEEAVHNYQTWKKSVDDTELPNIYSNVDRRDITAFFDSIRHQGCLGE